LQNADNNSDTLEFGVPKRYKIDLAVNSGVMRTYRGKLIETNSNANGPSNYFKEISSNQDIKLTVTYPYFK